MPTIEPSETTDPKMIETLTGEAWQKAFDELVRRAYQSAINYPPGYSCDANRDAIVEEQLRRHKE